MEQNTIRDLNNQSDVWWRMMDCIQKGFNSIIALDIEITSLDVETAEITKVGIIKVNAEDGDITVVSKDFMPTANGTSRCTDLIQPSYEALELICRECSGANLIVGCNINKFVLPVILNSHKRYRAEMNLITHKFLPCQTLDLYQLEQKKPSKKSKSLFRTTYGTSIFDRNDAMRNCLGCLKRLPHMATMHRLPLGRFAILKALRQARNKGCDMSYFTTTNHMVNKWAAICNEKEIHTTDP